MKKFNQDEALNELSKIMGIASVLRTIPVPSRNQCSERKVKIRIPDFVGKKYLEREFTVNHSKRGFEEMDKLFRFLGEEDEQS